MGRMSSATVCHLPSEVLVLIFSFLPAEDVGRAANVCSRWSQVAEDRRVWRGKRFLCEGSHGLSDALPIVRALPVLKSVSVLWGRDPVFYLSGESADFVVPDLRNEAVTSAMSALVTENLSVEFCLLKESCSNFVVVQLHKLKHLKICAPPRLSRKDTVIATLCALGDTLSREPLSGLQSVDIHTDDCWFGDYTNLNSDILGTLSTLSSLEQLSIRTCCFLSCQNITEFSKLQFLELQDCIVEDISFLDLCPKLHSLSLDSCSLLGRPQLSRALELRSLVLRCLSVNTEFVATLCAASPKLERISIDSCQCVLHTLFLGHCPQLCFVEVKEFGDKLTRIAGLPTGLQHMKLLSPLVTSDSLAEILQGVPRLEILDVISCNVESFRFLRHCRGLTELFLRLERCNTVGHFCELGGLRNLKKLHVSYNYSDVGPLAEALSKMDQLESLSVLFTESVSNLSFLRYCHRIRSLTLRAYDPTARREHLCTRELSNLKELRKLVLGSLCLGVKDLAAFLPSMPHLEELSIGCVSTECNFSFLRNCSQLVSLQFSCLGSGGVPRLTHLRKLQCLRRLTVLDSGGYWQSLAKEVLRLPKLEYLGLQRDGPNLLESWEWRKMLSSLTPSAESEETS